MVVLIPTHYLRKSTTVIRGVKLFVSGASIPKGIVIQSCSASSTVAFRQLTLIFGFNEPYGGVLASQSKASRYPLCPDFCFIF